ncbi:myosin-11-like isoform X2 [Mangifera indica]|uniref:myosin-11-like isoform X2 n=1 Tax=Mangifera indica TaxID=29780 RepID=UPI001CFC26C3|nr:myosin-11-like isoform X2 [Mangifera indica]
MFRLHKHKSDKFGEKCDFKFSNFQAVQIPKGWDKLVVSIISVETGKTIAKSGKATARNGNCRWIETFSESIWIQPDDASKDIEEYHIKLIVSMGSSRSGILGEASVNLASYMSSKNPILISSPLKKCNSGTVLQLKIQCLTPRAKLRDEQCKDSNSDMEDMNVDHDELENKSDVSDGTFTRSIGSSSSNHLDSASQAGEPCNRNVNFSSSASCNSFDSLEGSSGRENYSPLSYSSGVVNNLVGRQDSVGSQSGSPYSSSFREPFQSNQLSLNSKPLHSGSHLQNQREEFNRVTRAVASSPLRSAGSSKDLLEAAELKIEELRAEARMWEQNARKSMLDLEKLQKESLEQSTRQASLEMELSESHAKCDSLKKEIEQLRILVEESQVQPTATEKFKFQADDVEKIIKELEDEIKFQKESNADLTLQQKKTQESNIELLSILQELEETVAKQKMEIDSLSETKPEFEVGLYGQEVEDDKQINTTKQLLVKKMRETSCDSDLEGSIVEHPIRNLNAEVEQADQRKLELELQQLQEVKKNLESAIQFLEKSLEEKNHELEMERDSKTHTLMDCEAKWTAIIAEKEEKVTSLEAELSEAQNTQELKEMVSENRDSHNLIVEVDFLKQKIQELERDCNELTDENLELLLQLKKSKKDPVTSDASSKSSSNECTENNFGFTSKSEGSKLNSRIRIHADETNAFSEKICTDNLQNQFVDPGKESDELECQLQALKDKVCFLDGELCNFRSRAEEQESEIAALQQQLKLYQRKKNEIKDHPAVVCSKCKISESDTSIEISTLLSKLYEQVQLSLDYLKKQQSSLTHGNTACIYGSEKSAIAASTDLLTQKEQVEAIVNNFTQLKMFFEPKVTIDEDELQFNKEVKATGANSEELLNKLWGPRTCENTQSTCSQEVEIQDAEHKSQTTDPAKELLSQIDELKSENFLKEEEINALRHYCRELETQLSDMQQEKVQLEEGMEVMLREGTTTSKHLDDLRDEMRLLNSNMDSQVSANKILESRSSELEGGKHDLEAHLHEVEEENVQLSERICGLEAQLRYLTNDRESSRLELENSKSHAQDLQDEIRRLEAEMEDQRAEMKHKLQDSQKRWIEVQEECEYLKVANPKLQATAESLIEECSLLQKSNAELRKQKMKLHEHCAVLEAELGESEKAFSYMSKKLEALEEKYSSMLEEIASKEKAINLELDTLLHENKKHKDKVVTEESLLNQMYFEKTVEVQNLQREVALLTEQISATQDEKERMASEAVLEVSRLRAEKSLLEAALQEVKEKLKLSESNLDTLQMESQVKVQQLMGELTAAKQNQEVLAADHEKLLDLLEDVKSNEEKHRSAIRGLELKLKTSEYERLQVAEEVSSLKVQLEKTALLQGEVLSLKKSLNEVKFENERLEASFQILSGDYEELRAERSVCMEKISSSQKAISELEDYKLKKIALEEKVLRLEGDLTAREAIGSQEAVLKNELAQIRRENSQFQRKIKNLEKEKEECLKRAQALEQKLKQTKETKQDNLESVTNLSRSDLAATTTSIHDKVKEQDKNNLQVNEEPSAGVAQRQKNQRQVDNAQNYDASLKIQSLENELAEALEANGMYKQQLKRFLSNELSEDGTAKKNGYDRKAASLEAELKDLRERYFQMSLKYAEVEAEREQLVMKLKAGNTRRKWFS